MTLYSQLMAIKNNQLVSKRHIVDQINDFIKTNNFTVIELNDEKPWGAYFRFSNKDTERFIKEFFDGMSVNDFMINNKVVELSPKILLVSPGQRLSWQYHLRRSEIWSFLTTGQYVVSKTDKESRLKKAKSAEIIRFIVGDRHRLVGSDDSYFLVAEIWQHTDPKHISDEDDIVRLQDDYNR